MPRIPRSSSRRSRRPGPLRLPDHDPDDHMDVDPPTGTSYELNNTAPRRGSYASAAQRRISVPARRDAPIEAPLTRPMTSRHHTIMFYRREDPYFEFTNFSSHSILFGGREYRTAEHLFQAHKFFDNYPEHAEKIRKKRTAREALQEATRLKRLVRKDWFDVNVDVMYEVLRLKFKQNPELRTMLLETGDKTLVEDSPVDSFWGCGADGNGRNELGQALMRLRDALRQPAGNAPVLRSEDS